MAAMRYKARSGVSFRYGGSPSIISIAIIPSDQISTFFPYCFRVTTLNKKKRGGEDLNSRKNMEAVLAYFKVLSKYLSGRTLEGI
jgi:hypothetical protein